MTVQPSEVRPDGYGNDNSYDNGKRPHGYGRFFCESRFPKKCNLQKFDSALTLHKHSSLYAKLSLFQMFPFYLSPFNSYNWVTCGVNQILT